MKASPLKNINADWKEVVLPAVVLAILTGVLFCYIIPTLVFLKPMPEQKIISEAVVDLKQDSLPNAEYYFSPGTKRVKSIIVKYDELGKPLGLHIYYMDGSESNLAD